VFVIVGTNLPASLQHAERVLRILNLEDQIDGLVYCDYTDPDFVCKPEPEYYHNVRHRSYRRSSL
jgi:FMN phosphatase YigB (HAD superfamily)